MKTTRVILLLAVAVALAGCASKAAKLPSDALACRQGNADASAYRIGAGDVLDISVWNSKDLERTVTVRPDGMISFPLLDDVRAAGKTPMQLGRDITRGLKQYVTDPQVSVVVQAVHSFAVSVLGEVQHPGRYEMPGGKATVLDALAMAGGFTPYAKRSDIHVLREGPNGTRRIAFHYGRVVAMKPGSADFCVDSGDIVVVP